MTRAERRLARALLLCVSVHRLKAERQQLLDMHIYGQARRLDRKIARRVKRYVAVLRDYYRG